MKTLKFKLIDKLQEAILKARLMDNLHDIKAVGSPVFLKLEEMRFIIEVLGGDVYGEELDNYDNDGACPDQKPREIDEE
jgi:hypothetical protein|tara:strand:- start:76 stop:312 length:237 start_codon:yes stop_codon:yes gene_type:complete